MKPVHTGCERRAGERVAPDLEFVLNAAGLRPSSDDRRSMCPYRFKPACSPHLAAAIARRAISVDRIVACFDKLAARHQLVVVEGAGGVLVPLGRDSLMTDLMARLNLPVILVARPGLGTINHSLLSLREIRRAGLVPLGVVFNERESSPAGYIEEDNRLAVARLGAPIRVWRLPFAKGMGRRPAKRFYDTAWLKDMPSRRDLVGLLPRGPKRK
jgi:dethiobiotin synthetase